MSHRSVICQKKVTFNYPDDNIKMEIDRSVYPDDPDEPGMTLYTVELSGSTDGHAMFNDIKNLRRFHKAIGFFLDHLDEEGGDL